MTKALSAERSRVEKKELDWKKDGYADASAELPDLSATLKEWQRIKERDIFDAKSMTTVASSLLEDLRTLEEVLQRRSTDFDSETQMMLSKAAEAVSGELARQADMLHDPVQALLADLDEMARPVSVNSGPRQRFEAKLQTTALPDFWSGLKAALPIQDKTLSGQIDAVFQEDLRPTLQRWTDKRQTLTESKALALDRQIHDILASYDEQLAAIDDTASAVSLGDRAALSGLREGLHALAGKVAADTRAMVAAGDFPKPLTPEPDPPQTLLHAAAAFDTMKPTEASAAVGSDVQPFAGAGRALEGRWADYLDAITKAARTGVKNRELDWVKDGYAAAFDGIPDLAAALKRWRKARERDVFDRETLLGCVNDLLLEVQGVKQYVDENDKTFSGPQAMALQGGLDMLAAELAGQVRFLDDPVTAATTALDTLGKPSAQPSQLRQLFDQQLKSGSCTEVWTAALKRVASKADATGAAALKDIFSADPGKAIEKWQDSVKGRKLDATAVVMATSDLADLLARMDEQLAKAAKAGTLAPAIAQAMRDAARAIAGNVAATTTFLARSNAFGSTSA